MNTKKINFIVFVILMSSNIVFCQVPDSLKNVLMYYSLDSTIQKCSYPNLDYKSKMKSKISWTTSRFGSPFSSAYNNFVTFDDLDKEKLEESFSISFWYKSSIEDQQLLSLNSPNIFAISVYSKSGKLYFERFENLKKKYSYGRTSVQDLNINDNKWHHIQIRFAEMAILIMNVDSFQSYSPLALYSKKEIINLPPDKYGSNSGLPSDFSTNNSSYIQFPYSSLDDILISSECYKKNITEQIYLAGAYEKVLIKNTNEELLELKRLESVKFKDNKSVLMYLSNKSFVDSSSSKPIFLTFSEYAQKITINGKNYKLGGVFTTGDYIGNIEIYEYDQRLNLKFEINSKNNTVRQYEQGWGGLTYSRIYKFYPQGALIQTSGWDVKGVYKIEMKNPRTGGYDEIMMTKPGQYIEIKNGRDILINNLDIFQLMFGSEYLLFYNSAKFENGSVYNSNLPQTNAFKGSMELSNSDKTNITGGETIVYFMSGRGTNLVEIANNTCKCFIRLYYSDQVGLKME